MLKKVASFFNNMDVQILKTQRPMLLDALVSFEEMIEKRNKKSGTIEWSTPTECEYYVERLQQAAIKLAHEACQLRHIHGTLGTCVVSLMDIDMLKHRSAWKQRWQNMQSQISALSDRYPLDRMRKWLLHWDYQVCKVLEVAYCAGLETLNRTLKFSDSMKVELGFVPSSEQSILQFKPTLEEIRALYYRELKKFVSVPSAFNGLNGANSGVFCGARPFLLLQYFFCASGVCLYGREEHKITGQGIYEGGIIVCKARESIGASLRLECTAVHGKS